MNTWLVFIYKVPNEPSARRVYVWRKLKTMGAILLQDSAWVLPANPRTREKMQWLAAEIKEMEGGDATLWEASQIFTGRDVELEDQFSRQVDTLYNDIMKQLQKKRPDLAALSRQYQLARSQDYFQSELGKKVYEALLELRGKGES